MKRLNWRYFAVICAFTALVAQAGVSSRQLSDNWKFRQGRSENWYPATVPGTVHTDLMANDIIEDPFFRLNERGVQWVDKEDWMYETTFVADSSEFSALNQYLVFYGLDTYADVYLNHTCILKANNMHRTWKCDIKGLLKQGGNILEVYFHSPIKVDLPKFDQYPYRFNTGPDQSQNGGIFDKTISIFARKAGYHYGWDWGPRLVTSGIWRPIELLTWDKVKIDNVHHIQRSVDARRAKLLTSVEILSDTEVPDAIVSITVDGRNLASRKQRLHKGLNKIDIEYSIANPKLWWSNGLGDPYLYNFETKIEADGSVDSAQHNIGLRSLRMVTEDDEYGRSLYFELNGKPVFAKGVDMVPLDNFLPRITPEKYEKHVLDAKVVNANMIRVWGGGVYEDDYFYDLCDKHGILVWQDFMFACSTYPADSVFLDNVRHEAIDNVKRLRNHPSIAVWCGNNECQDVYYGWGNKYNYYKELGVDSLTTTQFKDLYFVTLPEVVKEYADNAPYRPSSPYAFEDTPSDGVHGDAHYWGVWHGRDSLGHYNVERARFFSEYGFQSFPEFESVKLYAPKPHDWAINSEAMMDHQRAGSYANNLIKEYMDREYRTPDDFPSFLYVSNVMQGDAIKMAVEAHRRDMPYCMGTLVWQHNDCWPVASWAGRDYYGRWKAQQYYYRKTFDDILVSPLVRNDSLTITVISDRRIPVDGTLKLKVMDLDGNVTAERAFPFKADALTSKIAMGETLDKLAGGRSLGDLLFTVVYETKDGRSYTNIGYGARQKFMNYRRPELTVEATASGDGFDLTIGSDIFARAVFLSLDGIDNFFSDNYFDILPGEKNTIHVSTELSEAEFSKQLQVTSLGHVYEHTGMIDSQEKHNNTPVRPLGGA